MVARRDKKQTWSLVIHFCNSIMTILTDIMTLLNYNMTLLNNNMTFCCNINEFKMSCYDKNVITPYTKSESVGYVKVQFFAHPLTL